jgi:hypothetical protein
MGPDDDTDHQSTDFDKQLDWRPARVNHRLKTMLLELEHLLLNMPPEDFTELCDVLDLTEHDRRGLRHFLKRDTRRRDN